MIAEEDIELAVTYLATSAAEIAQARADMIKAEHMRKVVKALLMKDNEDLALGAQEREALIDPRYRSALGDLHETTTTYERLRALREAARIKIEAWQTQSANYRAIKVT